MASREFAGGGDSSAKQTTWQPFISGHQPPDGDGPRSVDGERELWAARGEADRFRSALDALEDPLAIWSVVRGADGRVVNFRYDYLNPACAWLIERPGADVIVRLATDVLPFLASHRLMTLYVGAAEQGRSETFEARWDVGTTRDRWYEVRLSPLGDGMISIARDVTIRHEAMKELKRAEAARLEVVRKNTVIDERERIATELHKTLVRDLFDASLTLHAAVTVADQSIRDRLLAAIDQVDHAVTQMRAAVFAAPIDREHPTGTGTNSGTGGGSGSPAGTPGVQQ
jgi:signal transduction histidine kinase